MKKLIVLFSGLIIAAGAAAQADRTAPKPVQPPQTGSVDRKPPTTSEWNDRTNPAAEDPASANSVSPDFQGSSKQEATASGMGQPKKKEAPRTMPADKTGSDVQDVEDKNKK